MRPTLSDLYLEHVLWLREEADRGDLMAVKTLACLGLLASGWRFGDPDPDQNEVGEVIDFETEKRRRQE